MIVENARLFLDLERICQVNVEPLLTLTPLDDASIHLLRSSSSIFVTHIRAVNSRDFDLLSHISISVVTYTYNSYKQQRNEFIVSPSLLRTLSGAELAWIQLIPRYSPLHSSRPLLQLARQQYHQQNQVYESSLAKWQAIDRFFAQLPNHSSLEDSSIQPLLDELTDLSDTFNNNNSSSTLLESLKPFDFNMTAQPAPVGVPNNLILPSEPTVHGFPPSVPSPGIASVNAGFPLEQAVLIPLPSAACVPSGSRKKKKHSQKKKRRKPP